MAVSFSNFEDSIISLRLLREMEMETNKEESSSRARGLHSMIGRWEIASTWGKPPEGKGFVVRIGPLLERVMKTEKKAIEISMSDVCVKTGIRSLERLRNADTRYPCLVLEGAENPSKRKYRMIDGKHRVHKLVARGVNKVRCFVLKPEDVSPYVTSVPLNMFPHDASTAGDSDGNGILKWLNSHPEYFRAAMNGK